MKHIAIKPAPQMHKIWTYEYMRMDKENCKLRGWHFTSIIL